MVGGIVIEIVDCGEASGKVWLNVEERVTYNGKQFTDQCAIYVKRTPEALKVKAEDSLWWQGGMAYWTPQENRGTRASGAGTIYDIDIPRIGYSGVKRPEYVLTSGEV